MKKHGTNRKLKVHLGFGASLCALAFSSAHAGVYNIYLNTVEQGPNSTATPSTQQGTAADGKAPNVSVTTPGPGGEASGTPATPATPSTPTLTAPALLNANSGDDANVRLGLGLFSADDTPTYSAAVYSGFSASLSYFFSNSFGLTLGGGYAPGIYTQWYALAEAELVPLRFDLFGNPDSAQLGFLAGTSTLGAVYENYVSLYVGARASLNLSKNFLATATFRINRGMSLTEAGLAFRF